MLYYMASGRIVSAGRPCTELYRVTEKTREILLREVMLRQ